jgi:rhamnosyltransferase
MDKADPDITVVMATWNGEAHVEEQIASICHQQGVHWRLLVRDDGSDDDTVQLVRRIAADDERITFLEEYSGKRGVGDNFAILADHAFAAGANYIAFADQDDYWQPDKLARQFEVMAAIEAENPQLPVLVHSDLEVVDAHLGTLAPSFMRYQGVNHEAENALSVLLVQNFVTGCTIMANRKLLEAALPFPTSNFMHDWWAALCAGVFGRIAFIEKPLVKYRQHNANQIGAKPWRRMLNPLNGDYMRKWRQGRSNFRATFRQAEFLAARIKKHVDVYPHARQHLSLIEDYANLGIRSSLGRLRWLEQSGVHSQHPGRHALLKVRLLLE